MSTKSESTIEDLYRDPDAGKAERVDGEIVRMSLTGALPAFAAGEIFVALRMHARQTRRGTAFPGNVGYIVSLPNRRAFSPNASLFIGPFEGGNFLDGAPVFAAEVRSENDYGEAAEERITAKQADYFAAGTLVVWDVDVLREEMIRVYAADAPNAPRIFHRGEAADADPALPEWSMPVDDLWPSTV